jgi:hypothetical protein
MEPNRISKEEVTRRLDSREHIVLLARVRLTPGARQTRRFRTPSACRLMPSSSILTRFHVRGWSSRIARDPKNQRPCGADAPTSWLESCETPQRWIRGLAERGLPRSIKGTRGALTFAVA